MVQNINKGGDNMSEPKKARRPRRTRPPVAITLPSSFTVKGNVLTVSDRQVTDLFKTVKREQTVKEMRKHKSRSTRLSDAFQMVADAKLDIEELKDELEQWRDGMDGTNLEMSFKYGQLDEAIDLLDEFIPHLEELEGRDGEVEFPSMY